MRANIIKADFKSNFLNASGANDESLLNDLMLDEIAKLINDKPLTVIQAMDAVGYTFKGTTRGDLVKAVSQLLKESTEFATAIVALVFVNNGLITYKQMEYASSGDLSVFKKPTQKKLNDGGESGGGSSGSMGGGGDLITAVIGAVSNITGNGLALAAANKQAKTAEKVSGQNLDAAKINAATQVTSAKEATKQEILRTMGAKLNAGAAGADSTGKIILVLLLLAAVGGTAYMFFNKSGATAAPALSNAPAPAAPVSAPAMSSSI